MPNPRPLKQFFLILLALASGLHPVAEGQAGDNYPRPAAPLEFFGRDGNFYALEDYKGKPTVVLMLNETDLSNRIPALNAFYETYRTQGLVVLGIVVSSEGDPRALPQRLKAKFITSNFPLGAVSATECNQFFRNVSRDTACAPEYPQFVQIDRAGRIFKSDYFGLQNPDRLLVLSMLSPTSGVPNGTAPPQVKISPAASELYRKLIGAAPTSIADLMSSTQRVRAIVRDSYQLPVQKGLTNAGLFVDANAAMAVRVTVDRGGYTFRQTKTISGSYGGAFGVRIPTWDFRSSDPETIVMQTVTVCFELPGWILRDTGFSRLILKPYCSSQGYADVGPAATEENLDSTVTSAVIDSVARARAAVSDSVGQAAWSKFLGDLTHAERLYSSFVAARATEAPLRGISGFRKVSSTLSGMNGDWQPRLSVSERETSGFDVVNRVEVRRVQVQGLEKATLGGFFQFVEVNYDHCLIEVGGSLRRIVASVYQDQELALIKNFWSETDLALSSMGDSLSERLRSASSPR